MIKIAVAVVLAQLVERSLQTPEVRGSNPVIFDKNISLYWKDENKNRPFLSKQLYIIYF